MNVLGQIIHQLVNVKVWQIIILFLILFLGGLFSRTALHGSILFFQLIQELLGLFHLPNQFLLLVSLAFDFFLNYIFVLFLQGFLLLKLVLYFLGFDNEEEVALLKLREDLIELVRVIKEYLLLVVFWGHVDQVLVQPLMEDPVPLLVS